MKPRTGELGDEVQYHWQQRRLRLPVVVHQDQDLRQVSLHASAALLLCIAHDLPGLRATDCTACRSSCTMSQDLQEGISRI